MAKKQPSSDLRGLVIPDSAFRDATYTATTQTTPYAGPVVPDKSTGLVLQSSGDLDSASSLVTGSVIELETQTGGNVGDATIRWRYTGESMRSWEPPLLQAGWEFLARSTTASRYRHPHGIRRARTGLLAVAVIYDDSDVRVYVQSKYGTWTSSTVASVGSTTRATLLELPSGRLVCAYTVSTGTSTTQVRSAYSDDDGATWTTGSAAAIDGGIGYACADVLRIRAAVLNGQAMLLVWVQATYDRILQYTSADGGNKWSYVEEFSDYEKSHPDVCVMGGSLYVAYIGHDSVAGAVYAYVRRLASCSQPLSSAAEVMASGGAVSTEAPGVWGALMMTSGDCTIAASDEGLLYLITTDFGAAGTNPRETLVRVSDDSGKTWQYNHRNSHGYANGQNLAYSGSASTCLRDLHAVAERGRLVLLHSPQTNPGGVAKNFTSLCAAYLGGWTSVPLADPTGARSEIAGWDWTYVPTDLPRDNGATWTTTQTGAATESLSASGLTVSATAADRVYYTTTPVTTGATSYGIVAEWAFTVSSGSLGHELRISDGANDYSIRVTASTTAITVRDLNAGADVATLAIDTTQGVVLRVALDKASGGWATNVGRFRAWARVDGPLSGGVVNHGPRQDRLWTAVGNSSTLQSGGATTNRLAWGVVGTAGTGTYRWAYYSAGRETAGNIASGTTARGHIVPVAGSPAHLTSGFRIHGVDGPGVSGDTYTTRAAYQYPASAVNPFVSPSPRRRWRSTQTGTAQDITISGLDLGAFNGDVWACYVAGANWRSATLYRDTGAANKLLDIDLADGLTSLGFVRSRDLVYPNSGSAGASAIYFPEQALVGASVDFGGGRVRRVVSNTSGGWTTSPTGAYASTRLRLESYDAGDPTSGALTLRMPRGLFLFTGMQSTDVVMLRIPAQDTASGYFELGTLLIGKVRFFGRQYSRGRSIGFVPAYELTETRSGARQVRALGPTRRTLEIAWDDGIDTSELAKLPSEPDYFTLGYAGAAGLAAPADTALTMGGIIDATQGATVPVVVAPAVPQQASAPGTNGVRLLNPEASLYGRLMVETLRIDADANIMGDELRSPGEVVKVGSVRIEEEV